MEPQIMVFGIGHSRFWWSAAASVALSVLVVSSTVTGAEQPTIEELKARVANAGAVDRPPLCIHISERQLDSADRFFVAGDSEQAKAALADVVAYAELARDSAIQSHKHEKQSEIAIRKMARKLADLKHMVSHEDQEQVQNTVDRLQRIRDDLLLAMFPKGGKK
jgi:hypothetical protein